MKIYYRRYFKGFVLLTLPAVFIIGFNACKESKAITEKSGVQLWAENCQRCHNAPTGNTFSKEKWKIVGMHMQTRALLTNKERDKIVEFLQLN